MNTEELLNILTHYHLQDFSSGRELIQNLQEDDSKPLNELVVIDDAYWGGKKNDGVRGRGATGKTPFVASISLTEEGLPCQNAFEY